MRPAVALLAVVMGCAGPRWRELTSDHFTLWTNTDSPRARALIQKLEDFRRIVLHVAYPAADVRGRSVVIAFRDGDELRELAPRRVDGLTIAAGGNPLRQPIVVLAVDDFWDRADIIARHELAHLVSYMVLPIQPRWFAEGIAGYFESADMNPATGEVVVGKALEHMDIRLRKGLVSATQLFTICIGGGRCDATAFYTTAWVVIAYLINERPEPFAEFQRLLGQLPRIRPAEAWTAAFPDLTPAVLDREVRRWLDGGRRKLVRFTLEREPVRVAERMLGGADVSAMRALLHVVLGRGEEHVRRELQAALRADPLNVAAHLVQWVVDKRIAKDAALSLAAAHPDDWRAWLLVHAALGAGDQVTDALRRACALAAANPAILLPHGTCP